MVCGVGILPHRPKQQAQLCFTLSLLSDFRELAFDNSVLVAVILVKCQKFRSNKAHSKERNYNLKKEVSNERKN